MSDAMFSALADKAREYVSGLHKTANEYRQASGNMGTKDLDAWVDASTDPEIVRTRDQLAKAAAVIKEKTAELREKAKEALMPEGTNSDELSKKFKADKTEAKTFLNGAINALKGLGAPDEVIDELQQYLEQLPNVSGSTAVGLTSSGKSPEELAAVRTWARENGHEVSDKGRVPKEILEAWDKRHDATADVA